MTQPKLRIVPCHLDEAKAFVAQHHRHHRPPVGHKFSLAVADEQDKVRAVCIVGRPVARMLDDGMTLELTRLASDGCPNACSCLYGAAWRASKALGYGRLITYILDDEPGVTLKAAGWKCIGQRGGAAGLCRVGREWTSTRSRRNSYGKRVELRSCTRRRPLRWPDETPISYAISIRNDRFLGMICGRYGTAAEIKTGIGFCRNGIARRDRTGTI